MIQPFPTHWVPPYPYYPDYRDYELERLRQELRRVQEALEKERIKRELDRLRPQLPPPCIPWMPMAIGNPVFKEIQVEDILKQIKTKI